MFLLRDGSLWPILTAWFIFFNNGTGMFGTPTQVTVPGGQCIIGDLNGDHIADIVS